MYTINFIQNVVKEYIDKKIDKFIVYPFGINGMIVKKVLNDFFGMQVCFIVDNEYSKYNSKIINKDILKNVYEKDMYIILTAENTEINSVLLKELLDFIPSANLINLLDLSLKSDNNAKIKRNYTGEGFLISDFLPKQKNDYEKKTKSEKIKVRFLHSTSVTWNVIDSICKAFEEDKNFDILIILSENNTERMINQVKTDGYRYVMCDEYRVERDLPDILILNHPYDRITNLGDCRSYTKLIIVASMQLVQYEDSIDDFWETLNIGFGKYRPDYYLFDSLLYKKIRESKYFSEKVIEIGNAKFDGIYYSFIQEKEYQGRWKKLKDKKTVLWTTSHGIHDYLVGKEITFDLYAKTIFEYANNHKDFGIIFRPHSTFINEMFKFKYWNSNDLEYLKLYCDNSPNIVFDEEETYDLSFSIADGILTDAYCGIICSSLPLRKPICVTYRSEKDKSHHNDLVSNYYSAYKKSDLINFFEIVNGGIDTMMELREQACRKFIKHFDGKNGWRIKEFVKEKYNLVEHKNGNQ